MTSTSHTTGRLRRDPGLVGAVGIGLGAVMGAGIFVVTGVTESCALLFFACTVYRFSGRKIKA